MLDYVRLRHSDIVHSQILWSSIGIDSICRTLVSVHTSAHNMCTTSLVIVTRALGGISITSTCCCGCHQNNHSRFTASGIYGRLASLCLQILTSQHAIQHNFTQLFTKGLIEHGQVCPLWQDDKFRAKCAKINARNAP